MPRVLVDTIIVNVKAAQTSLHNHKMYNVTCVAFRSSLCLCHLRSGDSCWTHSRSEQNKCEAGRASKQGPWCHLLWSGAGHWSLGHQAVCDNLTPPGPLTPIHGSGHAPQPSRCSSHSMDHPAFFNIQTFAEMTILFGVNCENISMALHRTTLRDLAETAKVVSGRKFIRNSGEIAFIIRLRTDEQQGAFRVKPTLTLVWAPDSALQPNFSIAFQLKPSKSSKSFWSELFYQGFPRSKQLDCETMSFIARAVTGGMGTQQRIL